MNFPNKGIIIGLMSGSSCDGADLAFVKFPEDKLLFGITCEFSNLLRQKLKDYSDPGWKGPIKDIARLNFELSQEFNLAIDSTLKKIRKEKILDENEIIAIGSHGHTLAHLPPHYTLQIGSGSVLSALSKKIVVSDFRSQDVALGGQGAPLGSTYHRIKFQDEMGCGVQNIGGIGNLTYLPPKNREELPLLAFDTGPGNMLIDRAVLHHTKNQEAFDKDGHYALEGNINSQLLENIYTEEKEIFLKIPPPKSTGRELYGESRFQKIVLQAKSLNVSSLDLISTLTQFTVKTIAYHIDEYLTKNSYPLKKLLICGGGVNNLAIHSFLEKELPEKIKVSSTEKEGVDPNFLEAQAFAYFAWETLKGNSITLPQFTGSTKEAMAGFISIPS